MKYRNRTTNIGMMCGFGRMSDEGKLVVHQNSCIEMGFALTLLDSARKVEYDYEPVTVIYRVIPKADSAPEFHALHVCRMAKTAVPRSFYWSSRKWAINLPFYPFPVGTNDSLTPEIMASLADSHDLPSWLIEAMQDDPTLEEMVGSPAASKRLRNRLLLTGYASSGHHPAATPVAADSRIRNILFSQPDDGDAAIPLMLPMGTQGCKGLAEMAANNEPTPITLMIRPSMQAEMAPDTEDEVVASTSLEMTILQINVLNDCDVAA